MDHQARLACLCLALALAGCATTFEPRLLDAPDELRDVQTRTVAGVSVSVSILTDEQAREHFGVDLAERDLQALWISVRNASNRRLWFIRNVVDPDFYSADEAAHLLEPLVPHSSRPDLHRHLRDESIRALLLPMTVTEGYVYLPRAEGGRYVDIRLQGDAYTASPAGAGSDYPWELRFEFALALPDGDFDYERLDPDKTYAGQVLPDLTADELRDRLLQAPCCASDANGQHEGDPLNVVIVGSSNQVLNSLSRSGWSFTHRIDLRTIKRELGAALGSKPYPVAPVSNLYVFGRKQDVALQRARASIAQRNHMRLWLAPFTFEGRSVWIGQISRDIGIKFTPKSPTLTTHIIDPAVDETREYLMHSLLSQGFIDRFGFVGGSAAATASDPRYNLTDDPYFSDGKRLVIVLAPAPIRPEEIRSLGWEQSASPVAEGQSEAALRNVRPVEPAAPRPQ